MPQKKLADFPEFAGAVKQFESEQAQYKAMATPSTAKFTQMDIGSYGGGGGERRDGFVFTESDAGTKEKAKYALAKTHKSLAKKFQEAVEAYWWKVWETASQLCVEMGAVDTGTLLESIRLVWHYEPSGGLYEVGVSSQGVNVTAMIKVGGQEYINPKTGKACNYAQAVHDGTRYMHERPFLTLAIQQCEPFFQSILEKKIDEAITPFTRDY